MKTVRYLGMLAVVVMTACSTHDAQGSYAGAQDEVGTTMHTSPPSLDGKTFITDFHEAGSKEISSDTLHFAEGTCHSTMCDEYGFSKGSYSVEAEGDEIIFTATTYSEVDGEMVWRGRVNGDEIDGDVVWNKEGEDPITYLFKGSAE